MHAHHEKKYWWNQEWVFGFVCEMGYLYEHKIWVLVDLEQHHLSFDKSQFFLLQMGFTEILATLESLDLGLLGDNMFGWMIIKDEGDVFIV